MVRTIEANPGSVSPRKAALLKSAGVTRVSLGVQSWDDDLLRLLGREHNATQAEESFRILRAAEIGSLNVDLMFGLPGQTLAQWEQTLARTIALQPDHVSAYCLTYEEDTSDLGDGGRYFAEGGGGLTAGPLGVELSVKFAWNRLDLPVEHRFLTVPVALRGTLTF